MIDSFVVKFAHIKGIIASISIGIPLLGLIVLTITGINVSVLVFSTTTVNTFPCHFNKLNTATFPAAPRPRFPLR